MEITIYIGFIIGTGIAFLLYVFITKPEKQLLIKSLVVAGIWTVFGLLWDFLGINIFHLWDNTVALLPELWNIPVGNIPFCIFGGGFFVLLWNDFGDEKVLIKIVFLMAAAGSCGYVVVLMKEEGFLLHFDPYNSGWAYAFWLANLLMMVVMDYWYDKYIINE
jgi:hypothetical protein